MPHPLSRWVYLWAGFCIEEYTHLGEGGSDTTDAIVLDRLGTYIPNTVSLPY